MKGLPTLLWLAAAAALMVPPAQAAGCTQASPCQWVVDIGDTGFYSTSKALDATQGDWYVVKAQSIGDLSHTLTLSGYGVTLTLAADEAKASAPIEFTQAGSFALADQATNDSLALTVTGEDVVDIEQGLATASPASTTTGSQAPASNSTPAPLAGLLVFGLLAIAWTGRHR